MRLEDQIFSFLGTFLSQANVDEVLRTPIESLLREGMSDILSVGTMLTSGPPRVHVTAIAVLLVPR